MTNFWDLPKAVREKIYRMHLVQDSPVTLNDFKTFCNKCRVSSSERVTPCLLQADLRIEREAARFYFRENEFVLSELREIHLLLATAWPRHYNLIQTIVLGEWPLYSRKLGGSRVDQHVRKLAVLRGLVDLTIKLNEQEALKAMLGNKRSHSSMQWHSSLGYGPQVQLQLLHLDGINALREMRRLRQVSFDHVGNIPGGLLEQIRREITQPHALEE